MDHNAKWVINKKLERTMKALEANNFGAYYVQDREGLTYLLDDFIKDGEKVTFGGSQTLYETGTVDYLHKRNIHLLDRDKKGLTQEEINSIYREAFHADTYLASSNAVTEEGEIYNVDGNGNRVAAMIWGPKQVILLCGTNKIVKNTGEAIERNERTAGPANARRLHKKTPCAESGICSDCSSPERICRSYVTIKKQKESERIKIIFIEGNYGY